MSLEVMLEAERRGILPEDKVAILNEARKRGLVGDTKQAQPQQVSEAPEPTVPEGEFAPMPGGFQKGEHSVDVSLDRALAQRDWELKQTKESLEAGEIGKGSAALQTIGKGVVGKGLDYVGGEVAETVEGVVKGAQAAQEMLPEPVQQLSEGISEGAKKLAKDVFGDTLASDAVDAIGDYFSDLGDDISGWWKGLDKNTRKNLESAGLIAAVVPVKKTADVIHGSTVALKTSLHKQATKAAFEQTSPYLSKKRLQEVFKGKRLQGKKGVYQPTQYEKDVAETVAGLKGFKPTRGGEYNGVVVNEAREKAAKTLAAKYKATETPIVGSVRNKMHENIQALAKEKPLFVGPNTKPLQNRIKAAEDILKRNEVNGKHTTATLNKARKEFDEFTFGENAKANWAEGHGTALHQLNKNIRDTMNSMVDAHAPASLAVDRKKLGHLIYASDNMAEKFSRETKSVIDSAIHALSKTARISWAGKMLTGIGVGAGAAGVAANPTAAAGLAAIAGITYVGGKVVMSRPTRKGLLALMTELDKAGKVAKTAAEKIQIKKTRSAISALVSKAAVEQYGEDEPKQQATIEDAQ